MSMIGTKRKAAIQKQPSSVKRHKSEQIVTADKIEGTLETIDENGTKLLAFISDLLVQRQITKTRLPLNIIEAKNNWLKLEAHQVCLEVWWHGDERDEQKKPVNANNNKREGLREMMIHRTLRKFKVPNLLVADLDFEFNGNIYLLRRIQHKEISLEDFIQNFTAKNIDLTIEHIQYGVQSLNNLRHALRRDLDVFTTYTAANAIITVIDAEQVEFNYKVTNEFDMIIPTTDGFGEQWYVRGSESPVLHDYALFESMATAAEMIGASPHLVNLIRGIPTGRTNIIDVMHYGKETRQSVPQKPKPKISGKTSYNQYAIPKSITINDQVLQYVSEQVMNNMALSERPTFVVKEDLEWRQCLEDQHRNCFEVVWYNDVHEGRVTAMVHKIMREAKVPHLLTADFGFEYGNHYATVRQYNPKLIAFGTITRENNQTVVRYVELNAKDIIKGLQQMTELFSTVTVPRDQLSESRPVALTSNCFSASEMWLLPDGQGSYDFKYLITSFCGAMKLADDRVGVMVYGKIREASFDVFHAIGRAAKNISHQEVFDHYIDLNPSWPEFTEKVAKIVEVLQLVMHCEITSK